MKYKVEDGIFCDKCITNERAFYRGEHMDVLCNWEGSKGVEA